MHRAQPDARHQPPPGSGSERDGGRLHPFDFVFGAMAAERFTEIRVAAERSGHDVTDRTQFEQLGPVQALLGELAPADASHGAVSIADASHGAPAIADASHGAAAIEEYGTLVYAAFRYWEAGARSFDVSARVLESEPDAPDSLPPPAVPGGACYLRLPASLVWARVAPDAPPEPLDGVFTAMGAGDLELTLVAVLGLRAERHGFSQISLSAPAPDFLRSRDAVRRPLFSPVLEGGARAGVKSLVSEAELMYLVYLALADVGR